MLLELTEMIKLLKDYESTNCDTLFSLTRGCYMMKQKRLEKENQL